MLKDRNTNTELFVVIFQLIPTEEAKKETGIESAEDMVKKVHGGDKTDTKAADNDEELD